MDKPLGGTELQRDWLLSSLPPEITEGIQILSRPESLDSERVRVLWVQDMPKDMPFITEPSARGQFARIVFVSGWQQMVFNLNAGVPFSESAVIKNAVFPIHPNKKPGTDEIRIIYHPTPHRGLQILVPVFEKLAQRYPNIHLDVFSNFDLYARGHLNADYEYLYDKCRNHPQITYHGTKSNDVVREFLARAHIFAYPSIWRETSCMSAMEAMTAGCLVVAPNYGALPETLANFNISYSWTENQAHHASIFEQKLEQAINMIDLPKTTELLHFQKKYADKFYNKETRIDEWIEFLQPLINLGPKSRNNAGIHWMR